MNPEWISRQPLWVAFFLLLAGANLLILNEANAWLSGAKTALPGTLLFFLTCGITWFLGKKFFGKQAMLFMLLVLSGSLLLVNGLKWATGDPMELALLVLTFLGMLGYLKQPLWSWRLLTWAAWTIALAIQPLEALLAILPIALVWRFRHPKGRQLDSLFLWIWGPVVAALAWWWNGWQLPESFFFWSWSSENILAGYGIQFLGMLPWLGFLVAGIVDLFRKGSKGEELSILLGGLLLGALLSNTLLLQWAFALLVAKQLQRIGTPGYPFGNLVKTFTVLPLLAWLLAGISGLVAGYVVMGGSGYRIGVSLILAYWIPVLFGAIGLFGNRHRLMSLGMAAGALLFSLAFWTQLGKEGAIWVFRNF